MRVAQVRRGHTFALKKALSHVPAVTVVDMHHNKRVGCVDCAPVKVVLAYNFVSCLVQCGVRYESLDHLVEITDYQRESMK